MPQLLLGSIFIALGLLYFWIGFFALRQQHLTRFLFAGMVFSMSLWSIFYGFEVMATSIQAKLLWAKSEYLGIVSLPVFWFLFSFSFATQQETFFKSPICCLMWLFPALTVGMVWTNELHHGIWTNHWIGEAPLFLAVYEHGWYFWLHTLYSYGLVLIGTAIMGIAAQRAAEIYRQQTWLIFFGMLFPILGNILYLAGLIPLPGLDITPIAFFPTALIIFLANRRYLFLETSHLPLPTILETLKESILVLDSRHRILYLNGAAKKLMGKEDQAVLGKSFFQVYPFAKALEEVLSPEETKQKEIVWERNGKEFILQTTLQPIQLSHPHAKGTLLVLQDITEMRLTQQRRERGAAILKALSTAAIELMRAAGWEFVAPAMLEALGSAADVSRVYIFQNSIDSQNVLTVSQRSEWVAPHATPQIDNPALQAFRMVENGFERWVRLLSENQVVAGLIRDFPEIERPLLEAQDIRSLLVLPIFTEGKWWGFIGFDECRRERVWRNEEIEALRLAAELLGTAIHRQEMRLNMERHQQMLNMMQDIIMLALQSHSLEHLGQVLVDHLGQLTGAEHVFLTLWDERQQRAIPFAAYGKYREQYRTLRTEPGQRTLTASVLQLGHTLIVEDTRNTPYLDPQIAAQFETRSMLILPLIAEGQRLGALLLGYSTPHTFTAQEITIGERIAALVALTLLKMKAVEQAERRAQEADTLRQVSAAVTSTLQYYEVIERILTELHKVIPYDSASVQLLKDGALEIVGGRGWENKEEVLGMRFLLDGNNPNTAVMQTLEPILLNDTSAYPEFKKPPHHRIRSWLGVPLIAHGRAIGLLAIDSHQENFFTPEQVELTMAFANQVAIALENARLYEESQAQALTDALTGIYNRRGLMELGKIELTRALRYQKPFSAIMLDIDHFKRVNDTYGHSVGDQVLQALARRCEQATRDLDLVGRYGGEEFLIFLPDADWRAGLKIANRLRILVAGAAIPTRAGPLRITISLGISQHRIGDSGLEELVERADQALYKAKERGRNQAVAFEEMHQT
ncbi:MAG: histidine kinase N-terminal 7TM domain-containing protein [Anaerolineales bacterium]